MYTLYLTERCDTCEQSQTYQLRSEKSDIIMMKQLKFKLIAAMYIFRVVVIGEHLTPFIASLANENQLSSVNPAYISAQTNHVQHITTDLTVYTTIATLSKNERQNTMFDPNVIPDRSASFTTATKTQWKVKEDKEKTSLSSSLTKIESVSSPLVIMIVLSGNTTMVTHRKKDLSTYLRLNLAGNKEYFIDIGLNRFNSCNLILTCSSTRYQLQSSDGKKSSADRTTYRSQHKH